MVANQHTLLTSLGPGNYSLWILYSGEALDIETCHPISFTLDIQQDQDKENFVSCHADKIPTSLNTPGLLDEKGFLHYHDRVFLDLENQRHTVTFNVKVPSLFRVFVEAHRVDIDVEISNSSGTKIARTIQGANKEESVLLQLKPNENYSMTFIYYTNVDAHFCETFFLEIGIEPIGTEFQIQDCSSKTSNLPNIGPLTQLAKSYSFSNQNFYYSWPNSTRTSTVIFEVPFSLSRNMQFEAHLGVHFTAGFTMYLVQNRSIVFSVREVNGLRINENLLKDTEYKLVVEAGTRQTTAFDTDLFETCAIFDFEMMLSTTFSSNLGCNGYVRSLPSSLSSPQYLGTSNFLHFQENFRVPVPASGSTIDETMNFTVRVRSFFRAFTELDSTTSGFYVGFHIAKDGRDLSHTVSRKDGEKYAVILDPGSDYSFRVTYTADFTHIPACKTWNLEMAIAPVPSANFTSCTTEKLPASTMFIPSVVSETTDQYSFSQKARAFSQKINFDVETTTYMRASIFYNFLWSDMKIRILNNGTSIADGRNKDNENEIAGIELEPGTYTLEVYEPQPQRFADLRGCADFTLTVGTAPTQIEQKVNDNEYSACKDMYFPTTFNSIYALSEYSGDMMHFSRQVRMNTKTGRHLTYFTVKQNSYFRVLVPPHEVDIDLTLDEVDADKDKIRTVSTSLGFEEEIIFVELTPGSYRLRFRFLPNFRNRFYYPGNDECTTFPVEIALVPVTYANSKLLLPSNSACPEPELEAYAWSNSLFEKTYTRKISNNSYAVGMYVWQAGLFTAHVSHVFATSGLYMELQGSYIYSPYLSAPANRTYVARLGMGFAFFDELLYPGQYELIIEDRTNYTGTQLAGRCTQFNLGYFMDSGNVPENYCDDADRLPSDLYSKYGGSEPFGGPQNPDGSVRIAGTHFIMPDKNSHNNILFKVHNRSWVRFFANSEEDNDIDFLLWNNVSKTRLVEAAVGLKSVESHIAVLEPQTEDYLLDVYVYDRSDDECTYVNFEMAIEPVSHTDSRLACPEPLPNPILPPSNIVFGKQYVEVYSPQFVFTKSYIDANVKDHYSYKLVSYSISIESKGNYSIYVQLGYDFLLTDFNLRLVKDDMEIATGTPGASYFWNSFADFQSTLSTYVEPGNYTLFIEEKIFNARGDVKLGECESFSLLLMASYVGQAGGPQIEYVLPPYGYSIDPSEYLEITVGLSEAIGSSIPSTYDNFTRWLKTNEVLFMEYTEWQNGTSSSKKNFPSFVLLDDAKKEIRAYFNDLVPAQYYMLRIEADKFVTENGTKFSVYYESHYYSTLDCNCGGHGRCSTNATRLEHCECDEPYAGTECKSCLPGYHRSGSDCVVNTACNSTTCNSHGTCDDSQGYPICTCEKRFDSTPEGFCSKCHPGYENYPDCTPVEKQAVRCTAPLLPNDLNTLAYLGQTGSFHVQNEFYIDLDHSSHDVSFTLKEDSYFRIYTEPHDVDIDIWLWKLPKVPNPDNKYFGRTLIANGISFNQEESVFTKLDGGENYMLTFQFIPYTSFSKLSTCETFNMELAITPVTDFNEHVQKFASDCTGSLPNINVGTLKPSGYDFYSGNTFSVSINKGQNFSGDVWSTKFEIPKVEGKVAYIEAEISYRFITGDMAIRVQNMENLNSVVYGFNDYNKHFLQQYAHAGNYSLFIYLPKPAFGDITPCVPFSFSLHISYTNEQEDVFNCDNPELPKNLNNGAYIGDRIHVWESYLVSEDRNWFTFQVERNSSMRLSATSKTPFYMVLERATKGTEEFHHMNVTTADGELLSFVEPGYLYRVYITYSILGDTQFCLTIDIEMEISPLYSLESITYRYYCPVGGVSKVPSIPSSISRLPYHFESTQNDTFSISDLFYAFDTFGSEISTHTFTLYDSVHVDIGIASHFLLGNIKFKLQPSNKNDVIYSKNSLENWNFIREPLEPGTYVLTIYNNLFQPSSLVPCVPFSFSMNVVSLTSWESDECNAQGREPLPKSLNLERYLDADGEIVLQSDKWAIPDFNTTSETHDIDIYLERTSILRIYVEEHDIDIDVHLYSRDTFSGQETLIGSGENMFGEESFVKYLYSGSYFLRFHFYNWDFDTPDCESFGMQLAVSAVTDLPPREQCDPSVKEIYPNLVESRFSSSSLPYTYDDPYAVFHYQQIDHNDYKKPLHVWSFAIDVAVDLHVEVGYHFLTGDLVLSLDSGDRETIYGKNEYSRNVLNERNLAPGRYNLTLYEPSGNDPSWIGCSKFSFRLVVDKARPVIYEANDMAPRLPSDLNSIAYLKYSDELHIQNVYRVLEHPPSQVTKTLAFHLRKESLVRASVGKRSPLVIKLVGVDTWDNLTSVAHKLSPGDYSLQLTLTSPLWEEYITSDFELAILDVVSADGLLNDCKNYPAYVPEHIDIRPTDGFYQFRTKTGVVPQKDIRSGTNPLFVLPFTTLMDSIVNVQIQYDFILSPFDIVIKEVSGTKNVANHLSTLEYNTNDLNIFINPGSYNLYIYQVDPWKSTEIDMQCSMFDLRITIGKSGSDRIDCTSYDVFPWDLNSKDGGSEEFGGPMVQGTLNIWGDKFLMSAGSKMSTKFHITQNSALNVFVSESSWANMRIRLTTTANTTNTIFPLVSRSNYFQDVALYNLHPLPSNEDYIIELRYNTGRFESCSSFSFGLALQPLHVLENELTQFTCSEKHQLPPKTVNASFELSSHFTQSDITTYTDAQSKTFRYEIEFTNTRKMMLDVSISYGQLYDFFTLRLVKKSNTTYFDFNTGKWDALSSEAGYIGIVQHLDNKILPEGSYKLLIEQPSFSYDFVQREYCYPYTLNFLMEPADGGPVVRYIYPATATDLDPTRDLNVELRFSEPLYTSSNQKITRSENTKHLLDSVYLLDITSNTKVTPYKFSEPIHSTERDDLTRWTFLFGNSSFVFGHRYQLGIENLFSADKQQVKIVTPHYYTMRDFDLTCSGHGTYNPDLRKCECTDNRGGNECNKCATGYRMVGTTCVVDYLCKPDSCGCTSSTGAICVPAGKCFEPQVPGGPVKCQCYGNLTGEKCEKCADGYRNYPACSPDCSPSCAHGICNDISPVCICDKNWAGASCNECAPGFTGQNCEIEYSPVKTIGIVVSIVIAVCVGAALVWWFKFRQQGVSLTNFYSTVGNPDSMDMENFGGRRMAGGEDEDDHVPLEISDDQEPEEHQHDDNEDEEDPPATQTVNLLN
eukprot:TRINITY_DN351_c0_g3_i1.p1 TRINITY_DN351_c0_g3~~TRINITY_DN351_c0_g3_i1.p1  ORF type:complete len:3455 (-),score=945.65 TRINITY_DN351_c0_g3_i1:93-9641(-)